MRSGPFSGNCCFSQFLPGMYIVGSNFVVHKIRSCFLLCCSVTVFIGFEFWLYFLDWFFFDFFIFFKCSWYGRLFVSAVVAVLPDKLYGGFQV